jgi:hypothetical protein
MWLLRWLLMKKNGCGGKSTFSNNKSVKGQWNVQEAELYL